MGINKGYLTSGRNAESDECLTPRYAVEPIIKYLEYKKFQTIWCPFDKKDSMYVRVLKKHGFNVLYSHINDGGDFFKNVPDIEFDCIVSNPPFSKKDKILQRLYELNKPFMMLLPQNSLQSIKRVELFIENSLEYLGFDRRICFYTKGDLTKIKFGNHFASGYFCYNVLPEKLIFEKLTENQELYNEY